MFVIKRISDPRLNSRVCGSYGLDEEYAFAYGAYKDQEILATAAFVLTEDKVALAGVDTGRRMDLDLVDGLARAAFSAQLRQGTQNGELDPRLPKELRQSLTKLGYQAQGPFSLKDFFAHRNCGRR